MISFPITFFGSDNSNEYAWMYAVGGFTTYRGESANRLVGINPEGTRNTRLNTSTGFNNTVSQIAVDSNGKIYCVGSFTSYNGTTANRIIRLNRDGTKDTGFDNSTGFNDVVYSVKIDNNGKIYVGGLFTSYKGTTANGIIRLNTDGSKDTGFDNSTGFDVSTGGYVSASGIAVDSSNKVYVGGAFTSYKGTTANRIIKLHSDGSKDTSFDNSTGFDTYVSEVMIDSNGKIYCSGAFTSYKGTTANHIIRLNTDGSKDTGFDNSTGFTGTDVENLAIDSNGKIYCVGNFTAYKGTTANYIIRLNTDGSKDTGFSNTTGFNSQSHGIALSGTSVYVCGSFTSYKGTATNGFVKIDGNNGGIDYLTFSVGSGFSSGLNLMLA